MLRHLGDKRTPQHNLKLAVLLGLTAGFVNAEGYLGFSVLTTNVTGHAALFAERVALQDWKTANVIALWMALFLSGAFCSGLILTITGLNQRFSYLIPIFLEIAILFFSALYGSHYDGSLVSKEMFAGSLLFAMGLQNSLVSMISGSVVRTTHLTGTFTDLGIEMAQFIKTPKIKRPVLAGKIRLRMFQIIFFLTGAVSGAFLFRNFGYRSFYAPISILIFVLFYDILRIKAVRYYHHIRAAH